MIVVPTHSRSSVDIDRYFAVVWGVIKQCFLHAAQILKLHLVNFKVFYYLLLVEFFSMFSSELVFGIIIWDLSRPITHLSRSSDLNVHGVRGARVFIGRLSIGVKGNADLSRWHQNPYRYPCFHWSQVIYA